jgi:GH15 family glucan-1,4-alpha-glucosidase
MRLAKRAVEVAGTPDRGIWEYRTEPKPQTFSSLMCWVAADRAASIAARFSPNLEAGFRAEATRICEQVTKHAWNEQRGAYIGTYDSDNLDAALLQMAPLRLYAHNDPRLKSTVEAIWKGLSHDGWLMRYSEDDGFGRPAVAFVICTFWLIEALAVVGLTDEARGMMDAVHKVVSPVGLLSEDYDTSLRIMSGNFPQAYSHVGLIRAAFAAAPKWSEVL